jgi:hypothetical protein
LAESIWVGSDEHEGVRAQPRKDLEPPPHWRLEAIARTPRPRSLHVVGGRAVFIEDGGDTSHLWLLELEGGAVPRRLTTGREPMPYWEDTHPRLSPTARASPTPTAITSGSCRPPAPRRASWSRERARCGSTMLVW